MAVLVDERVDTRGLIVLLFAENQNRSIWVVIKREALAIVQGEFRHKNIRSRPFDHAPPVIERLLIGPCELRSGRHAQALPLPLPCLTGIVRKAKARQNRRGRCRISVHKLKDVLFDRARVTESQAVSQSWCPFFRPMNVSSASTCFLPPPSGSILRTRMA